MEIPNLDSLSEQEFYDKMGKLETGLEWLEEVYFDPDRNSEFTKQDIIRVAYLVSRMLKFKPSSRAQAKEILADPWLSS
ncbi:hypothetical protein SLS63_009548 [Diaporthe eres]|uniref:Uncharacterized protein n=1 Tax=Diaporthe eres TaxID=83184 RepID=A0ABR1NZ87_DIAER